MQVEGLVCELNPGDTLIVPAYWFMHSELQTPCCCSLELQLSPKPDKLLSDGALQLQLSRMIETWVGQECGSASVRRWLQVGRVQGHVCHSYPLLHM